MAISELNETNFSDFISKGVTLVDFWAPWCGPCKMIAPTLDEISREDPGLPIGKVNIDSCQELATKFNVMSIPTLIVFKDGNPIDSIIGVKSKDAILSKIEQAK